MKRRTFITAVAATPVIMQTPPLVLKPIAAAVKPIAAAVKPVARGNTLLTPTMMAKEALRVLQSNVVFRNHVEAVTSSPMMQRARSRFLGPTVTIRRPITFEVES